MNPPRLISIGRKKAPRPAFLDRHLRRRYVDTTLQMGMLIALVTLEISLVIGGIVYLYFRFEQILTREMYRIHQAASNHTHDLMVRETLLVLGVMLAINLIGLLIADRIWVRYVRAILTTFLEIGFRTIAFDLRPDSQVKVRHRVIALIQAFRANEHKRAITIQTTLRQLDPEADFQHPQAQSQCRESLHRLRRFLPPYSRRFVGNVRWKPF